MKICKSILLALVLLTTFFTACEKQKEINANKIGIFSDPHYYNPVLGTEGEAFNTYLAYDRKLLAESNALMQKFTETAVDSDWGILLVAGDLTKDGEKISHEKLADYFREIEDSGTKVYVINGNHDVNNGESNSYNGNQVNRVENITENDFKNIYADFGYNEALATDTNSLSYVVEPVKGLIVIAMDSCRHKENQENHHSVTAGAFSPETYNWIIKQIDINVAKGKTVVGMMHHGIVEHHPSQSIYFNEYLVNNFNSISESFANHGMKVVFTGHYHAQDISVKTTSSDNKIYDVQTGSLVTYPCPYREVLWNNNSFDISSYRIEEIDFDYTANNFQQHAYEFLVTGLSAQVAYYTANILDTDNNITYEELALAEKIVTSKVNNILINNPAIENELTIKDVLVDAYTVFYAGKDNELFATTSASSIENISEIIMSLANVEAYKPEYSSYLDIYIFCGNFAQMLWAESFAGLNPAYSYLLPDDNNYQIILN